MVVELCIEDYGYPAAIAIHRLGCRAGHLLRILVDRARSNPGSSLGYLGTAELGCVSVLLWRTDMSIRTRLGSYAMHSAHRLIRRMKPQRQATDG